MKNEVVKAFRTKLAAAGTDERKLELFYSEIFSIFKRLISCAIIKKKNGTLQVEIF